MISVQCTYKHFRRNANGINLSLFWRILDPNKKKVKILNLLPTEDGMVKKPSRATVPLK